MDDVCRLEGLVNQVNFLPKLFDAVVAVRNLEDPHVERDAAAVEESSKLLDLKTAGRALMLLYLPVFTFLLLPSHRLVIADAIDSRIVLAIRVCS